MPTENEQRRQRARERLQNRQRGGSSSNGAFDSGAGSSRLRSSRSLNRTLVNDGRNRAAGDDRARTTAREYDQRPSFSHTSDRSFASRENRASDSSSYRASRPAKNSGAQSRLRTADRRETQPRLRPAEPRRTQPRSRADEPRRASVRRASAIDTIIATIIGIASAIAHAVSTAVRAVLNRFGLVKLLVTIVVVVVLVVFISGIVRGCTASQNAETTMTLQSSASSQAEPDESAGQTEQAQVQSKPDDGAQVDEDALNNLMGADAAAPLIEAAKTDENVRWIAAHYDQYDEDGLAVEAKLLKLAAAEPAAVGFVLYWPDKYPQDSGEPLTQNETKIAASTGQTVPRYYQWDTRWGYTVYSSTSFALTGCCPTALSMVYTGLTGNIDYSPYDMGVLAEEDGYATTYNGTDASFLPGEAARLGLSCSEIGTSSSALRSALNSGMVCIINVGEGDFTTSGHYIVAVGLDANGDLVINDPYSEVRSNKAWDIDTVISQTKVIYGYELA